MSKTLNAAVLLTAMGLTGAAAMAAVDPDPLFIHVEAETQETNRNDTFTDREVISVSEDFRDCFFITGKLQKDCIWDRVPKCFLVAYGKPQEAFLKIDGFPVPVVVEQIIAQEEGGVLQAPVVEGTDGSAGSIRLGVAALFDSEDGTINGLTAKGLHGETGEVTVCVSFGEGEEDRGTVADYEYTFEFQEGREALRLAYIAPEGVSPGDFAEVICKNDLGQKEVCYDVDFYELQGLRDSGQYTYCLSVIGGLDYDCEPTDTNLGAFDNNGLLIGQGGLSPKINDDGPNLAPYSELCVLADSSGRIRFAVTGSGDDNFNGLTDDDELDYFEFLQNNGFDEDDDPTYIEDSFFPGQNYVPGASLKNSAEAGDVIRLNREDFDESGFACPPDHGVCGGYCIKVRFVEHEENAGDNETPSNGLTANSVDFNQDGWVNGTDLATLLTFWGPIQ